MFNTLNASKAGSKGGKVRTKAKIKSARANGALGGHPSSRTLAERLLGRSIHPEQQKYIDEALTDMLGAERQDLQDFFQVEYWLGLGKAMNSSAWRAKSRRVPKRIQYLIKKFRLTANYYLRDVPMPKSYTVEYHTRSLGEQDAWDRLHSKSGVPCPPQKGSVDVKRLPGFNLFESRHKRGETLTVKGMMERGGSEWTQKRAEVAIKWLNATYPLADIHNHAEQQKEKPLSDSNQRRASADEPDPADYPGKAWSGDLSEIDESSQASDIQDQIELAESPGFPHSDESAEPPHELTPDDLPELTELPEPPDFQLHDEPS